MNTQRFRQRPFYMRFIFALFLLTITHTSYAADPIACESWWFDSGVGAEAKGLVQDYIDDGVFTDNNVCYMERRQEFVYILITALEQRLSASHRKTLSSASNVPFNDVSFLASKFSTAIKKAYGDGQGKTATDKFGILSSNDSFRPGDRISRIEALTMTVRAYEDFCGEIQGWQNWGPNFSDYNDLTNSQNWMKEYLSKGKKQGLTNGYLDESGYTSYFSVNAQVPRHETVYFVEQLLDQIEACPKSDNPTDSDPDDPKDPDDPPREVTISFYATGSGEGGFKIDYNSRFKLCDYSDIKDSSCRIKIQQGSNVVIKALGDPAGSFKGWHANTCSSERSDAEISFNAKSCYVTATFSSGDKLSPPTNLTASKGNYEDRIELSWSKVDGAVSYRLLRSTNPNVAEDSQADRYSVYTNQFEDTINLAVGERYYYAVIARAQRNSNNSDASSVAVGYLKEPPKQAQKYTITINQPTNGKIKITYEDIDSKSGQVSAECPSSCRHEIVEGTEVNFEATPTGNYSFAGWESDCFGANGTTARVSSLASNCSVGATFSKQIVAPELTLDSPVDTDGVSITPELLWAATDTDGNIANFMVTLKKRGGQAKDISSTCTENNAKSGAANGAMVCKPLDLEYGQNYDWTVSVTDNDGETTNKTAGFSTVSNNPPSKPTGLSVQQAGNVVASIEHPYADVQLTWQPSTDNEGQAVNYSVSLSCDNSSPIPLSQCQNLTTTVCAVDAGTFDYGQTCWWNVTASDGNKLSTSDLVQFSTSSEPPPNTPSNPRVSSGGVNIPEPFENIDATQDVVLEWDGDDPNPSDTVTFTIRFPSSNLSCQESTPLVAPYCTISASQLEAGKIYSWDVTAQDSYGNSSELSSWRFSVAQNQPPEPVTGGIIKQGGKIIDVANGEVVWPNSDTTFEWQPTTDKENDKILYQMCYVNLADFDVKTAVQNLNAGIGIQDDLQKSMICVPPYAEELSETVLPNTPKSFAPGANYAWIVSAKDEHGESEWNIWEFTTKPSEPKIYLKAHGGRSNTLLDWQLHATDSHVEKYRILRMRKVDGMSAESFDSVAHAIGTTKGLQYLYYDNEQLEQSKGYCYRIDALDGMGNMLYYSEFDETKNCTKYGYTTIGIEDRSVKEGETVETPVVLNNGGKLVIHSATLCVGYNSTVLEIGTPKATPDFHNDYQVTNAKIIAVPDPKAVNLPSEINSILLIELEIATLDPTKIAELNINKLKQQYGIVGPASLFNINFTAKQAPQTDNTTVILLDVATSGVNPNPEHKDVAGISDAESCGSLNEVELIYMPGIPKPIPVPKPIPIEFYNGNITLTKKGLRSGNNEPPRIYVRDLYAKGDVSGDGYINTTDGFIASGIALGFYGATPDQLMAGSNIVEVHDDPANTITVADVKAIYDYLKTQSWSVETATTRSGLRDSKPDKPILLRFDDVSDNSGATITSTLQVSNLTGLTAFSAEIIYDPAVISTVESVKLSPNSVVGNIPVTFNVNKSEVGRILIHLYTRGDNELQGSGALADLTFKLADTTTTKRTALNIAKTRLYDKYGRNFVTSAIAAQIEKRNGSITLLDVPESEFEKNVTNILLGELLPDTQEEQYGISILAIDQANQPISGVTITINGETIDTNADGYAVVLNLPADTYTVTATKADYTFDAQTCTIGNGNNCALTFIATTGPTEDTTSYAAYGTATNNQGGVAGVTIQLGDITTTTDAAGYWAIIGLQAGQYPVTATQAGQTIAQDTCTVGDNAPNCAIHIQLATDDDGNTGGVVIPPGTYSASGTITDEENKVLAGVTITIAGKTAMTDANGNYYIEGLTEGEYPVIASKDGYQFPSKTCQVGNDENCVVNLKAGSLLTLRVKAEPRRPNQGDNATYLITLYNQGSQTATNIELDLPLPANTTLVSLQGDFGVNCQGSVCTVDELAAGASVSMSLVVANSLPNRLSTTLTVTSNEYPTEVVNVTTPVVPYLSVEKASKTATVTKGDTFSVSFRVAVNANAPEAAQDTEFKLELSRGFTLVDVTGADCGISDETLLTCQLGTVAVDTSRDIQLNLQLDDFYALWASHRAVVKAANYTSDGAAVQTKVYLGDALVDIIVAIDVTGSMHDEIEALVAVVAKLQEVLATMPDVQPMIAVVSFRDDIYLEVATTHLDEVLSVVDGMEAQGGGACPEASYEAMMLAVEHIRPGGTLILVTDAPPYPEADINQLINAINAKQLEFALIQPATMCEPLDEWDFQ